VHPDPRRWWRGPLDVETLAWDAVSRVREAATALARARGDGGRLETAPALVAASFAAHEHLRVDGMSPAAWAELSGFVRAADGWVRLHGNYPHHAAVLRRTYGIRDRAGLERALARRPAAGIEEEVAAAGGIAVRVRERAEWTAHPQALARAGRDWAECEHRGGREPLPPLRAGEEPLAGVRILDLTRVIAGPTATQLLACLGADVLRVDPPHRPEILAQSLSTGMGKRSTVLDLREREGRERARALAASADVILTGYRPGALAQHGLGPEHLEALAPHAVIGALSAWGETGPWGERPGFDSIVQAATGIAVACGSLERPGALPVQALDHASGHLLAAHVLEALAAARARTVRVSLLGAAGTLLALPAPPDLDPAPLEVPRRRVAAPGAVLDAVPPPLLREGATVERAVGGYGASAPSWAA
jgi:crotonobetainyl-CoA:carnitine CoA-transferase CaiB-like acyl-CoA transferase